MTRAIESDLTGRTCVVTGASAGIGKVVAGNLARAGATVVLACRSPDRGRAALDLVVKDAKNAASVSLELVDLGSQARVRDFARALLAKHAKIDVLVNNAGVWLPSRETSPDGFELTWATNALGYHLLTNLLLPALKAAGKARIVNVASTLAGGLDLDDLDWQKRGYDGKDAYAQTKQANRMLTWALAERLAGKGVTANAAHPGFVRSELFRRGSGLVGLVVSTAAFLAAKSVEKGADTPTWLAASPEVEGVSGKLFADRRELKCGFRDPVQIEALWETCERMTAVRS
ncbi:SDR family NAD(P)-dependent oxidoreductase [bacterium]|nr:SDR family NAD(P)-dependent oxidoreductase [bacterium]